MVSFPISFGGTPLVVAGSGTILNSGALDVFPTITITGPIGNPHIKNVTTGQHIRFLGSIPAGVNVSVDMAHHAVGGGLRVDPKCADWFPLAPGANDIRLQGEKATTGTALTIIYRSTTI